MCIREDGLINKLKKRKKDVNFDNISYSSYLLALDVKLVMLPGAQHTPSLPFIHACIPL